MVTAADDCSSTHVAVLLYVIMLTSCCLSAGLRPYMEDRHTLVASYTPTGPSGVPCPDGINRSFVAIYDGHNGVKTAEQCSSRWACCPAPWPAPTAFQLVSYTHQMSVEFCKKLAAD